MRQKRHNCYLHPMRWSIDFPIPPSPQKISHQSKILSMGSCFAQTIGQRMGDAKLDVLVNPFGTVFHPVAISELLNRSFLDRSFEDRLLTEREGLFHHFLAHSDIRAESLENLMQLLRNEADKTQSQARVGTDLILTFGTAWGYELLDGTLVANCHKVPQNQFRKRLWSIEEMKRPVLETLRAIRLANPAIRIILTVSPVRHLKDGVAENQLSKSMLRALCQNLQEDLDRVDYFPAYEILMDELRDYRFYKTDLIHPSEEAENYIWERWQQAYFTEETKKLAGEINKIRLELAHRPFNPDTEAHRKFLRNLLEKLERLNSQFDFSREIEEVTLRLRSG